MFTDSLIIMVNFLYLVSIALHFARMRVAFRGREVVYPSATLAEEVRVRCGHGIIACVSPVYGQRLNGTVVPQEFQGVVHRCLGEGGHGGRKGHVNLVHRGMRAMRQERVGMEGERAT